MKLWYSDAAGITADRVADKSSNNVKIRRAGMYREKTGNVGATGIFVEDQESLSLSLSWFSAFSQQRYSSVAVTHRFSILAKCPRTVIFLRWLVTTFSRYPVPVPFSDCAYVEYLDVTSFPGLQTLKIQLAYRRAFPLESTDNGCTGWFDRLRLVMALFYRQRYGEIARWLRSPFAGHGGRVKSGVNFSYR